MTAAAAPARSPRAARAVPSASGGLGGRRQLDLRRAAFLLLGAGLFAGIYLSPAWPAAIDPQGRAFALTHAGQAAIALFLFSVTRWASDVVPAGVTSIALAVIQVLFGIRAARAAFADFMHPAIWFVFASLALGLALTKTGLTRRLVYRTLMLVGERTDRVLLGCLLLTMGLTLVLAHTAVAATVYPVFLAVHALYAEEEKPTRFGKALFIGMAFVASAGSIITLLGSARAVVAIGFLQAFTGGTVGVFELSYYLLPVGLAMTVLLWLLLLVTCRPEKRSIPGLGERARRLHASLGPISPRELVTLAVVLAAVLLLALRATLPALAGLDPSAVLLASAVLLFVFRILTVEDLEGTSWNVVLLFGGAMSLGNCLWQTGAARWLGVELVAVFPSGSALLFVLAVGVAVMLATNVMTNIAVIALVLPTTLVAAPYVGVTPEVVLFVCLAGTGMPFLLLFGAAPNAIAYASRQFTAREFFLAGLPASVLLALVLALFVWLVWPAMGMSVLSR